VGLFGGFLSFFFWALFFFFFFSFSSIAFSIVYCQCTKGRLTLLIKPGYYLSKKKTYLFGEFFQCLFLIIVLKLGHRRKLTPQPSPLCLRYF